MTLTFLPPHSAYWQADGASADQTGLSQRDQYFAQASQDEQPESGLAVDLESRGRR
ncbi:hypothetical protein [Niveibacterium umoris]|uniref:Uncharacterized protein n=1 Tax=Niveibacterium umoris TaxID=1193620 RepID=A0A840BK46_9RHOO|nr:hypothetical protein [Niveibacterium umoris]MBB4011958.1 hypothetical protein [Niveibacterium umoris]